MFVGFFLNFDMFSNKLNYKKVSLFLETKVHVYLEPTIFFRYSPTFTTMFFLKLPVQN